MLSGPSREGEDGKVYSAGSGHVGRIANPSYLWGRIKIRPTHLGRRIGGSEEELTVEICSVYADSRREMDVFKWIESEKVGYDLGEVAVRRWVQQHWCGYLRARWMEHLQGRRFWVELDRNDFGLLQREFRDDPLLDRILDRLKAGQENLDIICWALDWGIDAKALIQILEALDINSRRLAHRFDP